MDFKEIIYWISCAVRYVVPREACSHSNSNREAVYDDDKRTTLFGGARQSWAFRARRDGLPCIPTHLEHSDQETGGISRCHADRAKRQILLAYGGRTGGG